MFKFDAAQFLIKMLALVTVQFAAKARCAGGTGDETFPSSHILHKIVAELEGHCKRHGMKAAAGGIHHLKLDISKGASWRTVAFRIQTLRETITTEISQHAFAYVPADRCSLLDLIESDWRVVWKAFPNNGATEGNIRDGVEAYALGLHTASVFHMMLVLESGLTALVAKLQFKPKSKDWGGVIGEIETEIGRRKGLAAHTPKGTKPLSTLRASREAKLLSFCSEAARECGYFKDAWRNHVAHGRARYDENDGKKVMVHVREFMTVLARNGLRSRS